MDKPRLEEKELRIEKLKESHAPVLTSFCCGDADKDLFLKKDALTQQALRLGRTFLLLEREKLVSYITLTIGSIHLSPEREFGGVKIANKPFKAPPSFPCMLIGRLATDEHETDRGGASYLIRFAVQRAIVESESVPFPFLALHAYPGMVSFYEDRGFEKAYTPNKKAETTCMYMQLPFLEKLVLKA